MLDDEQLLAHLAHQSRLLTDAFARCDPATPVPGLDWNAQTVAMHTGAVHRWAADILTRGLQTNETGGSAAFWPSAADAPGLAAWLDEGVAILVTALRNAPTSLACFTFVPEVASRSFWIRRQAHETAIHRGDLEGAAGGPVTPVDASFAQDGLAELVGAFATEPVFATTHTGRLLFDAADGPAWLVTFGGERNVIASGDLSGTDADATVRGTSDQLYRWAWNRPTCAEATGDLQVLASWRAVRVK